MPLTLQIDTFHNMQKKIINNILFSLYFFADAKFMRHKNIRRKQHLHLSKEKRRHLKSKKRPAFQPPKTPKKSGFKYPPRKKPFGSQRRPRPLNRRPPPSFKRVENEPKVPKRALEPYKKDIRLPQKKFENLAENPREKPHGLRSKHNTESGEISTKGFQSSEKNIMTSKEVLTPKKKPIRDIFNPKKRFPKPKSKLRPLKVKPNARPAPKKFQPAVKNEEIDLDEFSAPPSPPTPTFKKPVKSKKKPRKPVIIVKTRQKPRLSPKPVIIRQNPPKTEFQPVVKTQPSESENQPAPRQPVIKESSTKNSAKPQGVKLADDSFAADFSETKTPLRDVTLTRDDQSGTISGLIDPKDVESKGK